MTEDDEGIDDNLDYTAWEAPSPPPGIADAVVAKLRRPIGAPDVEPRSPRRLRGSATGGIAAAAAAGITILAWPDSSTTISRDTSGNVVAAKPSHVELGASTVALDANAEIKWSRDGAHVAVAQPRGSAMWRVAPEDTLVIDAGATVASVEASGASLRVEVSMNLADKRVIGVSAGTAAVVAMVTVIVYEGHVKVSGSGQTVQLVAGGTAEVRPGEPPREPPIVAVGPRTLRPPPAPVPFDAGDFEELLQEHAAELQACGNGHAGKVRLDIAIDDDSHGVVTTSPNVAFTPCLEDVIARLNFPQSAAGMTFRSTIVFERAIKPCDPDAELARGDEAILTGDPGKALKHYDASLACKQQDTVVAKAFIAACNAKRVARAKALYPKLTNRSLVQVCLRNGIDPATDDGTIDDSAVQDVIDRADAKDCDAKRKLADMRVVNGDHAAAVLGYEAVMRCDPSDSMIVAKAFLAACNAKLDAKARALYPRLAPANRGLRMRCIAYGMEPDWFPDNPRPIADSVDRAKTGVLRVNSEPWSTVTIDGDRSTARATPAKFDLSPGKHKVTFATADGDKYTFSVTIDAGKTTTLTKQLD